MMDSGKSEIVKNCYVEREKKMKMEGVALVLYCLQILVGAG